MLMLAAWANSHVRCPAIRSCRPSCSVPKRWTVRPGTACCTQGAWTAKARRWEPTLPTVPRSRMTAHVHGLPSHTFLVSSPLQFLLALVDFVFERIAILCSPANVEVVQRDKKELTDMVCLRRLSVRRRTFASLKPRLPAGPCHYYHRRDRIAVFTSSDVIPGLGRPSGESSGAISRSRPRPRGHH